jgi:hypothetical protein
MPRISKRSMLVKHKYDAVIQRRNAACYRYLLDMEDELQDEIDVLYEIDYYYDNSERYLFRPTVYKTQQAERNRSAHEIVYGNLFTDLEFTEHFRIPRETLIVLLNRLFDKGNFARRNGQGSAELHFLALLKFLGSNGNEATPSKMGRLLKISKGTFINYVARMVQLLLLHLDDSVFWPNDDERMRISARIKEKYRFPDCLGFIDGTVLPLETKPNKNGEDYFAARGIMQ